MQTALLQWEGSTIFIICLKFAGLYESVEKYIVNYVNYEALLLTDCAKQGAGKP